MTLKEDLEQWLLLTRDSEAEQREIIRAWAITEYEKRGWEIPYVVKYLSHPEDEELEAMVYKLLQQEEVDDSGGKIIGTL